MADLKVKTLGKQAKSAVPESVFAEPFNESLIHETVTAEMNARRQGTHSSLTRGEVAMTGAKAWKQKGTGRARVGALSVGHRRGGGPAFGPKPRHYISKVNRKARRKALRSALSVHAARDTIAVLPAGSFDEPKTSKAAEMLGKWGAKGPTLIVIGRRRGRRREELPQPRARRRRRSIRGRRRRDHRRPLDPRQRGRARRAHRSCCLGRPRQQRRRGWLRGRDPEGRRRDSGRRAVLGGRAGRRGRRRCR